MEERQPTNVYYTNRKHNLNNLKILPHISLDMDRYQVTSDEHNFKTNDSTEL